MSEILGNEIYDIVKLAVENTSAIADGVVQYDYETGKLVGAGFTSGTIENPANPVFEVYRISQNTEFTVECYDCTYDWDEELLAKLKKENPSMYSSKEECCRECWIDNLVENLNDDDNLELEVERLVRDVLSDHIGETISKLNEIRVRIFDRLHPEMYWEVRQDNWEMRVLDSYVDSAMDFGFTTTTDPIDYCYAEMESLIDMCYNEKCEDKVDAWTFEQVEDQLINNDLDGALELLQ